MILREVREDPDVERQTLGARECQRVGRHLHRHAPDATIAHVRQHRLQLQRLRRRLVGGPRLVPEHVLDGADHAGGQAARAQQRLDQIRGRGLAVGPGDSDQRELARWMPVVGAGKPRQRHPRRRHEHLSDGEVGDRLALGDDDGRAAPDRVGDEATAVLLEARHRHEAGARLDAARVARDRRHRGRQRADHALLGERREQVVHGRRSHRHLTARAPRRAPA